MSWLSLFGTTFFLHDMQPIELFTWSNLIRNCKAPIIHDHIPWEKILKENSKKPQCSVRYLSEVLPPQASDTKEMFLRVSIYDSRGSTMAVNDGCQGLRSRGGKPRIGLPSGFSTKLSHVQWEIRQTRKRGATFFPPCWSWRICRIS